MLYKACFVNRDFGYYNVGTGKGTSLLDQIKGIIDVFTVDKVSPIELCPEKIMRLNILWILKMLFRT